MLMTRLQQELAALEQAGLRRRRRVVTGPCGPLQQLAGAEQPRLSFCSNDYLGLAGHPALAEALAEGAQRWGVGSGASHLVSGHSQVHEDVEQGFVRWQSAHIPQAAGLLFCSGFMANMALMTALSPFILWVGSLPSIADNLLTDRIVWSPAVLAILAGEILVVAVALGWTQWFHSRKTSFL